MPTDVWADVLANTRLSDDYNVLSLAAPPVARAALPGQFVMVKLASGHDPLLRRPFSVFEVLRDDGGRPTGITLLNKRIGASTGLIYRARPGDRMACLGPLGQPWVLPSSDATAYLVAGGVGLAAFATLSQTLNARRIRQVLFYGARTAGELLCLELFQGLGVELVLTTEDGSQGARGRVTEPLERRLVSTANANAVVYACGPDAMMAATARIAARARRPCFVSLERTMGCGLGGCYSCVVSVRSLDGHPHYVRSCLAGPVMAAEHIVWGSGD